MFYPVFKCADSKKLGFLFGFEPGESLEPHVAIMLLEEGELPAVDILLENGFQVKRDLKPAVDLSAYGFSKKLFRALVFFSKDRIGEFEGFFESYRLKPFEVLLSSVQNCFSKREFELFGRKYSPLNPLVMGIINVTDDSFYEKSRYLSLKDAVEKAEEMVALGASIIDVGGQSSRPGSDEIPLEEELERVVPVVREISKRLEVPVSVDTYRREVAEAALDAGARMINDIFGLRKPGMMELAISSDVPVVVMHLKGDSPKNMQENPHYLDVVSEISAFFNEITAQFEEKGGNLDRLVLDPGIGFGKRYEDNLAIIANLNAFTSSGLPLLIGHSRKSFIGIALDGLPPEERLFGSLAAGCASVLHGASILRVHDVKETIQTLKVISEIRRFSIHA